MNILERIVERKHAQFFSKENIPDANRTDERVRSVVSSGNGFLSALSGKSTKIIGEVKPKSPSAGELLANGRLDTILSAYRQHCVAVSVLTDEEDFGGSFDLLEYVRETTGLPVLCKDFIISPRQIELARNAGADAVLLIAKILTQSEIQSLLQAADKEGVVPVVEVSTKAEADKLAELSVDVVLINNRNLTTMEIDLNNTGRLAKYVRNDQVLISASGINNADCVEALTPHTNTFLVGSSLMRCADPATFLAQLKTQHAGIRR